jgi:hypothetical protein
MSTRNLLTLNAIFALLTAVVLIFSPSTLTGLFEIGEEGTALQLIQLFGAASVGYGFSSWLMRNAGFSEARSAFLKGGGAGYLVVGVVTGYSVLNGLGRPIIWVGVAFSFLLGVMFLYFGISSSVTD